MSSVIPDNFDLFDQHVSESDIDWVLCIELNVNPQFQKWLMPKVFAAQFTHIGAWRSISDINRESDLIWAVKDNSLVKFGLIENKLKAPAQREQFEGYVERGNYYSKTGQCDEFQVVLFCPQDYKSADSHKYPIKIFYEDIRDWFSSNTDGNCPYFHYLMVQALSKKSRLYPPDPEITDFRRSIWLMACDEFPKLGITEPNPGRETWLSRSYGDFTVWYKYISNQKETASYVDLSLPGRVEEVASLALRYREDLKKLGAKAVPTYTSASFRIRVPLVQPPEFDEVKVREALEAWSKLLNWWKSTVQP